MKPLACSVLFTLFAAGCAYREDKTSTALSSGTTFTALKSAIFSPKCSSCHPSSGGLDTSDYNSVLQRVTPGTASTSTLYIRVNNNTMPPSSPFLSDFEKAAIAEWINNGALNN